MDNDTPPYFLKDMNGLNPDPSFVCFWFVRLAGLLVHAPPSSWQVFSNTLLNTDLRPHYPMKVHSSDQVIEHNALVSASPTFSPRSQKSLSDTIFRSSDAVHFHVYSKTLLQASESAFKPLINGSLTEKKFRNEVIDIPDSSAILDVILRVFYNIPVSEHSPSLDVLETAVRRMVIYGLVPSEWITPSKPMFEALYSYTPTNAIRVYALAGLHGLRELAERTSAHLLSYNLADLSDDLAKRMGAKYLRRLMSLHLTRVEELKRIIFQPPHTHPPTPVCGIVEQRNLSRAWAVAASYLAWDSKPGVYLAFVHVYCLSFPMTQVYRFAGP